MRAPFTTSVSQERKWAEKLPLSQCFGEMSSSVRGNTVFFSAKQRNDADVKSKEAEVMRETTREEA